MSTLATARQPLTDPSRWADDRLPDVGADERHLRALPRPAARRRPRIVYALVATLGALAIGVAQMGLSIAMTEGGYAEKTLQAEQRALVLKKQEATDALNGLTSPQFIASNAAALGMVTGQAPSYLRLSDGAILGSAGAASASTSVDAGSRGSVQNSLVAGVPLVTDPQATMTGPVAPEPTASTDPAASPTEAAAPALPPALSTGLPTPSTH